MSGRPGGSQRFLDFALSLPRGSSDATLEQYLARHSPGLAPKTQATRLSDLRVLTDATVRSKIATIFVRAASRAEPASARYTHEVLYVARRVRDGEPLP